MKVLFRKCISQIFRYQSPCSTRDCRLRYGLVFSFLIKNSCFSLLCTLQQRFIFPDIIYTYTPIVHIFVYPLNPTITYCIITVGYFVLKEIPDKRVIFCVSALPLKSHNSAKRYDSHQLIAQLRYIFYCYCASVPAF